MTDDELRQKTAEWMIVGFVKAKDMIWVAAAVGLNGNREEEIRKWHEVCPFAPGWGKMQNRSPVRAYFASEFPKLSEWLIAHEKDAAKLMSVAPQLMRLTSKGAKGRSISAEDGREVRKARKEMRHTTTVYRASRDAFKTHQRSAWNVCK
jgi:hypothetical protein